MPHLDASRHELIDPVEAVALRRAGLGFQGGASLRCIAQRDEQLSRPCHRHHGGHARAHAAPVGFRRCTGRRPSSHGVSTAWRPPSSAAASSRPMSCTIVCFRIGTADGSSRTTLRPRRGAARRPTSALNKDGYAVVPFAELVPDTAVWSELEAEAARFAAETEAELDAESEGSESDLRRREGKEFLVRKYAYDVELGLDDPWLRLGYNRRLLDVANSYVGMWSKLEYVDLWYTPPAAGGDEQRKSSQRWHRDFNDRHLLKAFLYLVDVDEETGPVRVCAADRPGRRAGESLALATARRQLSARGRACARRSPTARCRFTAPKGTIIFCNTCRLSPRRVREVGKPRVLATVTYSSPASLASLTQAELLDHGSADQRSRSRAALRAQLKNGVASTRDEIAAHVLLALPRGCRPADAADVAGA